MSEIPIFTSKAHVFVIDPVSKKSWIPSSKSLVQVNFFFDSIRNTYRIISVEGSKAVINCTVVPDMVFTKTSGKFGQWSDLQAGIVYGLGFNDDSLLSKFSEQFDVIREKAEKLKTESDVKICSNELSETNLDERNHKTQRAKEKSNNAITFIANDEKKSTETVQQSDAELKQCLRELDEIKEANKKLTSTLHESMANANEWHTKLISCKEQCDKYQKKINQLEDEKKEISQSLNELKLKNESLQHKNSEASQEYSLLQQRIGVLSVVEIQHNECAARIKSYQEENVQLQENQRILEEKIEDAAERHKDGHVEVRKCCTEIADHLSMIAEATQKLQNSM